MDPVSITLIFSLFAALLIVGWIFIYNLSRIDSELEEIDRKFMDLHCYRCKKEYDEIMDNLDKIDERIRHLEGSFNDIKFKNEYKNAA